MTLATLTFFSFCTVIMLKLLPEHLCLGQSTTILWNAFYVEVPLQTMHSLLEIGAQSFISKGKSYFSFPKDPMQGKKRLRSRTRRTGDRGRAGGGESTHHLV